MHLLAAQKPPALQLAPAIRPPEQRLHLVRRPRAQTGDVAVVDEAEWDEGNDVGEEKLEGPIPEVDGREEADERAEEEDGYQAGDGAGLQFEYTRHTHRHQHPLLP